MTTVISGPEQRELAELVAGLAARHAPLSRTRQGLDTWGSGARPDWWPVWVEHGLAGLHLPEHCGGDDAGLAELAVVAETTGRLLLPGPWLPTALAGAVLGLVATADPAREALRRLAGGATAAMVDGVAAAPTAEGWLLRGTSAPALGVPGAEVLVVRALSDAGDSIWAVLPVDAPGVTVLDEDAVDLTRSVGRLRMAGVAVPSERVLTSPPADTVELIRWTLYAAESVGIADWALSTAVAHLKSREQFGRPLGSFQALQHRAALMLVRTETAAAATWDAVRAETDGAEQQRLAAAQAAATAVPAALDVVLDCLSLLGAIGFTWEHDAHLYWRRALSLAGLAGAEEDRVERLALAALGTGRNFAFVGPSELPELRAQVGAVLDRALAQPAGERPVAAWSGVEPGERSRLLADAGLIAPHYPAPYGLGAGPREQAVIADEFAGRGLAQPGMVIGEWVLPTLLAHGSPAQQDRFLAPTLRGEIVWCQLFSEPGAGSDLAGVATRARRVDGGWSLTGQKIWTTLAHQADWGVCLARTDSDAPRHRGLTYFLVDMRVSGVQVRPIRQATGQAEFNEVFLDEVLVPDAQVVGEPGQGWRLATTTLANERLRMGRALTRGSSQRIRSLIDAAGGVDRAPAAVRAYGRCVGRELALAALDLRSTLRRIAGDEVGAQVSVQKVFNAIAQRDGSRALIDLLGPAGATLADGYVADHLGLPAVLFGGGTIEIQLNVIATRVLGLPR